MARPSGRPNDFITGVHPRVSERAARQTAAPTFAMYITLLAFNGFAVRFSRSAIFFISEFFATIWPVIEILRSLVLVGMIRNDLRTCSNSHHTFVVLLFYLVLLGTFDGIANLAT